VIVLSLVDANSEGRHNPTGPLRGTVNVSGIVTDRNRSGAERYATDNDVQELFAPSALSKGTLSVCGTMCEVGRSALITMSLWPKRRGEGPRSKGTFAKGVTVGSPWRRMGSHGIMQEA